MMIIYKPDFSNFHEITHATSIRSTAKYGDIGKFSMVMPINDYNLASIEKNGIIYDTESKNTYILVNRKIETKNNTITVNGYSAEWLLSKRGIAVPKYYPASEEGIYQMVRDNLRGLPIELASLKGLGGTGTYFAKEGQLIDNLIEIAKINNFGFRVNFDYKTKKFTFEVYKGKDLTSKTVITKDEHTKLLLHGDDISDSSLFKVPLTNNGVLVKTDKSKFGGKSLYFDGKSKILYPATYNQLAQTDWTIDWWEYAEQDAIARYSLFVGMPGKGVSIGNPTGVELNVASNMNKSFDVISAAKALSLSYGEWVHWAIVRKDNVYTSYKNGIKFYEQRTSIPKEQYKYDYSAASSGIGVNAGNNQFFKGYIDEFRISDVARWTSDFEPPTKPYKVEEKETTVNLKAQIFSYERGNARALTINEDVSLNYTTFTAVGKLNGVTYSETYSTSAGLGDEKMIDCGETTYTPPPPQSTIDSFKASLKSRAMSASSTYTDRKSFKIEIEPKEYGVAYNLGDIVTCISTKFGVKFNKRITSVNYQLDANGAKTDLILGEPELTKTEADKLGGY